MLIRLIVIKRSHQKLKNRGWETIAFFFFFGILNQHYTMQTVSKTLRAQVAHCHTLQNTTVAVAKRGRVKGRTCSVEVSTLSSELDSCALNGLVAPTSVAAAVDLEKAEACAARQVSNKAGVMRILLFRFHFAVFLKTYEFVLHLQNGKNDLTMICYCKRCRDSLFFASGGNTCAATDPDTSEA